MKLYKKGTNYEYIKESNENAEIVKIEKEKQNEIQINIL